MTGVADQVNTFLASFEEFARSKPVPQWLAAIRERALMRFAELGFPDVHQEDWRFTNVAPIARTEFALEPVNVRVSGAQAMDLCHCWDSKIVQAHLANSADFVNRPFVALNTAFLAGGAFVHIPKGVAVAEPIQIVYENNGGVTHPRTLVVAERESQATIIETYLGPDGSVYFTNAVTEIVLGENAVLDHYKLELEGEQAYHVSALQVEQGRSANFSSHSFSFGGALVRNDAGSVLSAGSECTLNGLYLASGTQHIDNHTVIDHAQPHGTSHELYKGILDGRAQAVFSGTVLVRQDAQKTDAKQTNQNLVLSEEAVINTKPELQIFADDVKCTHGATIGQLDAEAIFYLQSRGIGKAQARDLLTVAFARDIIDRVKVVALREQLERALFEKLHGTRG